MARAALGEPPLQLHPVAGPVVTKEEGKRAQPGSPIRQWAEASPRAALFATPRLISIPDPSTRPNRPHAGAPHHVIAVGGFCSNGFSPASRPVNALFYSRPTCRMTLG